MAKISALLSFASIGLVGWWSSTGRGTRGGMNGQPQDRAVLILRSISGPDTARVGVDTRLGGSIVEVSWNGVNPVNRYDAGREIQIALYDGSAKYDFNDYRNAFGWDPVQAGDRFSHGGAVIERSYDSTFLFTRDQPPEWYPDNKGGGASTPVPTDTRVSQRVSVVPGLPGTFRVQYIMEHLGSDQHYNSFQEVPAVYVDKSFNRFEYYGGQTPWQGDSVTTLMLPDNAKVHAEIPPSPTGPTLFMPEHWGSFVNPDGVALTVYSPGEYPYGIVRSYPGPAGPTGRGANYYRPTTYFSMPPGGVVESDVYLIVGPMSAARDIIKKLRISGLTADQAAPVGYVDSPRSEAAVSGRVSVSGWAMDNVSVAEVDVLVDGVLLGKAGYGAPRLDIAKEFPFAAPGLGFSYQLESSTLSNGKHQIQVRAIDSSGNSALLPPVAVTVQN